MSAPVPLVERRDAWILYGPTLRSGGGFASLHAHVRGLAVVGAVLPAETATLWQRLAPECATVPVPGHLPGARALRGLVKRFRGARVFAVQNPVIPFPRPYRSLIQNYQFVTPAECVKADPSGRSVMRVAAGTVCTLVQVVMSHETVMLNSRHPWFWPRLTSMHVAPNVLLDGMVRYSGQRRRDKIFAYVGSYHRFRGLHIVISAFRATSLANDGWRLIVHANRGSPEYETYCKSASVADPGVIFAPADDDAQRTLSRAHAAVFPSRVEGSSLAYLEALQLCPRIVALYRAHYVEPASTAHSHVEWVESWDPRLWRDALLKAASR